MVNCQGKDKKRTNAYTKAGRLHLRKMERCLVTASVCFQQTSAGITVNTLSKHQVPEIEVPVALCVAVSC